MADLAKLAIEVDASQATAAAKQLQVLGAEAAKSEKSTTLFRDATGRVRDELGRFVAAANVAEKEVLDFETAVARGVPAAMRQAGQSARQSAGSFKMAGNGMQMMGYQIQDIAVQLGGGMSPFVVLSQQGSQIASLFGPGGAVVGAMLAIAGAVAGPVVSSLMRSTEQTDRMKDAIKALREELNAVTEQQTIKALEKETTQLQKGLEMLSSPVRSVRNEGEALLENITGVSAGWLSNSDLILKSQIRIRENNNLIKRQKSLIEEINAARMDEFGPSADDFYAEQLRLLKEAKAEQLRADAARVQSRADSLKAIEALESAQITQQERLTDSYQQQQYAIASALSNELDSIQSSLDKGVISTEEAEAMKVAAVEDANAMKLASDQQYYISSYQLALQDAQQREALNASMASSAQSLNDNLVAALEAYGQESSDLGLAAIAVQKGLMVAQAIMGANMAAIQTQVAYAGLAAATLNPALIEVGAARAEIVRGMGYASAALIAATEFAPARALGGQVTAGTTYLVGERGPELVTMGANGYVTPNDKIGGKSAPVINVIEDASRAGTQEVQRMSDKEIINIFVANIRKGGAAYRAVQGVGVSR